MRIAASAASIDSSRVRGMAGLVAVVTDSTAYLPADLVTKHAIAVVTLQVIIGGRPLAEGIEADSGRVARALRAGEVVTTSRPAPAAFARLYRDLHRSGASSVVSVHLSGEISGTVDAARSAAAEVAGDGVYVEVVDSRSLGMGLGYAVLAAAAESAAGADAARVAEAAARRALESSTFLYVDTLEYLRRGGRIGAAQAFLGSALAVKPLLHLVDGRLEPLDRVRTRDRALTRLVRAAVETAGTAPVDLAVHHLAASPTAVQIAGVLRGQVPGAHEVLVVEVGAVVGAHVGPGMLAVVVSPRTG